jgi:ABC-2 type transport system permease protein
LSQGSATLPSRPRALRGPSALSGNWREFRDLLIATSITAFRKRYIDTILGFAWMFLGPLLTFGVVYIFVVEIVRRFSDTPDYGELLLLNVTLFNLFQMGSSGGMRSLVGGGGMLKKMPVPRAVMPLSAVATALYVTAANMIIVLGWLLIGGVQPHWTWLLLPVIVLGILVVTIGIALLLAGLYVRFRDLGMIWPVFVRILFFISPVIYPFPLIRAEILWKGQIVNPLAPVLAQARHWMITPSAKGWFEARGYGFTSFLPFIVLALIWVIGVRVFKREAPRAAESV